MTLSIDMANALRSTSRDLCWLAEFETGSTPLYCWSGMYPLAWDSQTWLGVGHLYSVGTIDRGDALSYRTQQFTVDGLDPQVLAGMDESVQGRDASLRLAARNDAGQIITSPLLVQELAQDTLQREINGDGTITLTLNCFEALPRFDKPTGRKWSQESQQERFSGDEGFYYTQKIARTGPALDWRPA